MVGIADDIKLSTLLTEDDLKYYVQQFKNVASGEHISYDIYEII